MPTKAIKPALTDSLRSLAECQLQMQTARSAALLEDLAEDLHTNDQALARKLPLFARAQTLLVLAIVVELAGRL